MTNLPSSTGAVPPDWDRKGLPAWPWRSNALFALEREQLFVTHWQRAVHDANIPASGDGLAFDLMADRTVVMRGADGVVRAFHNLCLHRVARVGNGDLGHCKGAMVCPFHGWAYKLDGTLRGAA